MATPVRVFACSRKRKDPDPLSRDEGPRIALDPVLKKKFYPWSIMGSELDPHEG
jgi:hypothetical protein